MVTPKHLPTNPRSRLAVGLMLSLKLGPTLGLIFGTSGCLTHMFPEQTVYRELHWAETLESAEQQARSEGKPLLVVMAAGELYGACCVGADALRSGALSDPVVIAFVNERFVPIWINIRKEPVPNLPGIDGALTEAVLDQHRHVADLFGRSFFARSTVFSPDLQALLNPAATDVIGSFGTLVEQGHFAFAEMTPKAYLHMLERSLARLDALQASKTPSFVLGGVRQ